MNGFGERLRARAKELGLTDSEVARRLDLSQARYSHYVNGVHEPDLPTLVRIAQVLDISTDRALGVEAPPADDELGPLRARIAAAAARMDAFTLRAAVGLVEAIVPAPAAPAEEEAPSRTRATKSRRRKSAL